MKTTEAIITGSPVKVLSGEELQMRASVNRLLDLNLIAQPDETWVHPSGGFHLERLLGFERRRLRVNRA